MHFLVMGFCSHDFVVYSYVAVCKVKTYERLVLNRELSMLSINLDKNL